MKVIFDESIGEIIDFVDSLMLIVNSEELLKKSDEDSLENRGTDILKTALKIKNSKNFNLIEEAKKVIPKEDDFLDFIPIMKLYESNVRSIEDLFDFLTQLDDEKIIKSIGKFLSKIQNEDEKEKSFDETFNLLKTSELSPETKWLISCAMHSPKEYLNKLIDLYKKYYIKYDSLFKKEKLDEKHFREEVPKKIKEDKDFYVKDVLDFYLKNDYISSISELVITTSYISGVAICLSYETDKCILILAPHYKKSMMEQNNKDSEDKFMLMLKNLADPTRYKILKLLSEKDYYGQELAKALDITTATVSYHMSNLLITEVVTVEKKDHRIYYSLKKEGVLKTFDFLKKEFKL